MCIEMFIDDLILKPHLIGYYAPLKLGIAWQQVLLPLSIDKPIFSLCEKQFIAKCALVSYQLYSTTSNFSFTEMFLLEFVVCFG